jgi:hypothetical protein
LGLPLVVSRWCRDKLQNSEKAKRNTSSGNQAGSALPVYYLPLPNAFLQKASAAFFYLGRLLVDSGKKFQSCHQDTGIPNLCPQKLLFLLAVCFLFFLLMSEYKVSSTTCVQRSAVGPVPAFILLLFVLSKSQFKQLFSEYERARHWAYRLL